MRKVVWFHFLAGAALALSVMGVKPAAAQEVPKTATLLDNFGSVAKIKAPPRGRTEVAVRKGKNPPHHAAEQGGVVK
jgi:hypothetical protein